MARWYPVVEQLAPMIEAPDRQSAMRHAEQVYGPRLVRMESAASLEADTGRMPDRLPVRFER